MTMFAQNNPHGPRLWTVIPLLGLELSMRQSGKITEVVGQVLSQSHLRQKWLDNELSKSFLTIISCPGLESDILAVRY